MGLLRHRDDPSPGGWEARVQKAPRWSAAAGQYAGAVNGDIVTGSQTRREARRIARAEAQRREREDR